MDILIAAEKEDPLLSEIRQVSRQVYLLTFRYYEIY